MKNFGLIIVLSLLSSCGLEVEPATPIAKTQNNTISGSSQSETFSLSSLEAIKELNSEICYHEITQKGSFQGYVYTTKDDYEVVEVTLEKGEKVYATYVGLESYGGIVPLASGKTLTIRLEKESLTTSCPFDKEADREKVQLKDIHPEQSMANLRMEKIAAASQQE